MKRSIQKWLPFLLTLALLASCLPGIALAAENTQPEASQAQEASEPTTQPPEETEPGETEATDPEEPELPTSGKWGDNITWEYADGVLTVSGTGDLSGSIAEYWCPRKDIKKVVVGEGVTSLWQTFGSDYFPSGRMLETVILPQSLRKIGPFSFSACTSLKNLELPEGLEVIDRQAFSGSGLTSMEIPASVTEIGEVAFLHCTDLTSVVISTGVKTIGSGAFADCSSLTSVKFLGDAPEFPGLSEGEPSTAFGGVKATVYYPAGNATWTEEVMQQYGGELTWVSYEPEASSTQPTQPAPSEAETEPTAAPDPDNPKTGDPFAIAPLTLVCVLSMGAVLLLIVKKKDITR